VAGQAESPANSLSVRIVDMSGELQLTEMA